MRTTYPPYLTILDMITLIMLGEITSYEVPHYTVFYIFLCHLFRLRSKYSLQHPALEHLQPMLYRFTPIQNKR